MVSIKFKHIVIGILIIFILSLFHRKDNEDYSYEYSGTHTQIPIQSQSYYHSMDWEQDYPSTSTWSSKPSSSTRHEILQTKVKGYREETYWGEASSTADMVRYMDDDEFKDYLEEVELNDADVYWGAEY